MTGAIPSGRIVIAGGSGFLGLSFARFLADASDGLGAPRAGSHAPDVVILSRSVPSDQGAGGAAGASRGPWRHVRWDGRTMGDWARELDGASGVVNLAGRTVDCIKTPLHCDQILRSRVESTRVLGEAVRAAANPPSAWVQMSTAHRYGDGEETCDEDAPFGYGLAPFVGEKWEEAFDEACPEGIRGVVLRTSFVLGRGGGAYQRLAGIARLGLGGTVGSGRQGMSWIHELDMNRLFARGLTDETMRGAYIASAPNPVSNREFMRELRRALRVPIGLPAMGWMVNLAAPLVLRTDPELALYGRYCVSRRLAEEGFAFEFPGLGPALADVRG
ncbi:MAG: DUF1731 domain-containing protein [Planctomycetota bacterium]